MVNDLFWESSFEDMKKGYGESEDHYHCLLCGESIEKGIIYPVEGVFYEAKRYMKLHVEQQHGSVFQHLIELDKEVTGLSDHQKNLVKFFKEGKSDSDIQKEMGIGSSSTIRNHRFTLKKKERQAKVFLTLMELLNDGEEEKAVPVTNMAPRRSQRYSVSDEEREKILAKNFPQGLNGPLRTFHLQEKHRLVVLEELSGHFDFGSTYTEKEVNDMLTPFYDDYAVLRRYLIEYGFLERSADGSSYWRKGETGMNMDSKDYKKQMKQLAKEVKTEGGVYQIKNLQNDKIYIGSTPNIKTLNGVKFTLKTNTHQNKELQNEWNTYGADAFSIEMLETIKREEEKALSKKDLLKLEAKWLEKLQPYGEKGYHSPKADTKEK
ncbi:DUF2087 domain-containing protein [Priestia sp. YIM B13448]|uniref:DUF2087 domain-containing protein n=1 Tax=Priestia TaxID=2800373 RepID=UPI00366DC6BB